jgi:hypothetical protein
MKTSIKKEEEDRRERRSETFNILRVGTYPIRGFPHKDRLQIAGSTS